MLLVTWHLQRLLSLHFKFRIERLARDYRRREKSRSVKDLVICEMEEDEINSDSDFVWDESGMVKIPKVCLDDAFMPTIDSVGSGKDEGKDKAIALPRAVPALTLKIAEAYIKQANSYLPSLWSGWIARQG
jgi:hypothetical protein